VFAAACGEAAAGSGLLSSRRTPRNKPATLLSIARSSLRSAACYALSIRPVVRCEQFAVGSDQKQGCASARQFSREPLSTSEVFKRDLTLVGLRSQNVQRCFRKARWADEDSRILQRGRVNGRYIRRLEGIAVNVRNGLKVAIQLQRPRGEKYLALSHSLLLPVHATGKSGPAKNCRLRARKFE